MQRSNVNLRGKALRKLVFCFAAIVLPCSVFASAAGEPPLAVGEQSPVSATVEVADEIDFNRDIRPILSDKCFACHGPDAEHREAELRLDVREAATEDRGGYAAVVAGNADASEAIKRITAEEDYMRMPPEDSGKSLDADEIELLKKWIDGGANYDPPWAYVPPQQHGVPFVQDDSWPLSDIDRFILARIESEGLSPNAEADKITLIRRLSFDLTGLPPTPEEVDAFVGDASPHAYERLVDRLLASEHFGERMAIYWLDLVRFADTVGYHGDQDHNISPYRDWVIDAFNDNMPFDQFTREQLAGDLLPDTTTDQLIATGYNRLLQTSHEGGVQPKEYLAIYGADRVRNISAVWMGATLGCAQCHDHKYDPYTARDFYSMKAFFADIDDAHHLTHGADRIPTMRRPETKMLTRRERQHVAQLTEEIDRLMEQLHLLVDGDQSLAVQVSGEIRSLEAERQRVRESARMMMFTKTMQPRETRILPRGNWLDDSGEIVEPTVPAFLGDIPHAGDRATRLDLANWLTASGDAGVGGLTARVFANRYWYLFFGVGLAKDLQDFGGQGEPPEHPELLDHLALRYLESGWDTKSLVKDIVMSRAYRQTSNATKEQLAYDPENRLYARQSRYRLPAEMVRDSALAVSGLLVDEIGGGSVKPYQPAGYYRHLNFPPRKYQADRDMNQWRRGVYVHWQRQFLHPTFKALDAPSREECTAERPRSNTPLAALALLNDPTFLETASFLAASVLHNGCQKTPSEDGIDDEADDSLFNQRLDFMYRQVLSREPDEAERELLHELYLNCVGEYRDDLDAARKLTHVGIASRPDDLHPAQWAAWTTLGRAVMNCSEAITRN